MVDVPNSRVPPSGADFATASMPSMPEAPGRFSVTKGRLKRFCQTGASRREHRSGVVPGVKGTIILTGELSCACAARGASTPAAAPASSVRRESADCECIMEP